MMMGFIYGIFNVGIALAYLAVAVVVLPHVDVKRVWVKCVAVLFFVTCGFTHADMAAHSFFGAWPTYPEPHAVVNHAVQVLAAWAFVVGLYFEFARDGRRT